MEPLPAALLPILDATEFERFCRAFGSRFSRDGSDWFSTLLAAEASDAAFKRVKALAWFIFVERQGRHFGGDKHFTLTPGLEAIQELIYRLSVFRDLGVPFEEWQKTFSRAQHLVRAMLKDAVDLRTDPRRLELDQIIATQMQAVLKKPGYGERFNDYLNGAI